MIICGIDLETTGFDGKSDYITEVGAVLWNTETQKPLMLLSALIKLEPAVAIPAEITRITGITREMLDEYGLPEEYVYNMLFYMAQKSICYVAHNGKAFDKPFLEAYLSRRGRLEKLPQHPWIDTMSDVPYPEEITTRKLSHLAAEHMFLNPFAHRAVFDVLTDLVILSRYDVEECLRNAQEPVVCLRAHTDYPQRELAKARGYRWSGERKIWWRAFRESQVKNEITEAGKAGFRVSILEFNPDQK